MGNLDLKNKKKRWYVEPYPQSFLNITSALEGNQELGTDFCRKQGKYLCRSNAAANFMFTQHKVYQTNRV
jgi:hypothetical protein